MYFLLSVLFRHALQGLHTHLRLSHWAAIALLVFTVVERSKTCPFTRPVFSPYLFFFSFFFFNHCSGTRLGIVSKCPANCPTGFIILRWAAMFCFSNPTHFRSPKNKISFNRRCCKMQHFAVRAIFSSRQDPNFFLLFCSWVHTRLLSYMLQKKTELKNPFVKNMTIWKHALFKNSCCIFATLTLEKAHPHACTLYQSCYDIFVDPIWPTDRTRREHWGTACVTEVINVQTLLKFPFDEN